MAITKAFLAVEGEKAQTSARLRALVSQLSGDVVRTLGPPHAPGGTVNLEDLQDQVELVLMRGGHAAVARAHILHREERRKARAAREIAATTIVSSDVVSVVRPDGSVTPLIGPDWPPSSKRPAAGWMSLANVKGPPRCHEHGTTVGRG